MRAWLGVVLVVFAAACDNVAPVRMDLGMDLSAPDLAMPDLAAPDDLSMPDLAVPQDLSMPDLTPAPDLSTPPDLYMCTPNAFLGCQSGNANFCNASNGVNSVACGAGGCNGPDHCNQCTQLNTTSCNASTVEVCDGYGRLTSTSCTIGCASVGADADMGTPASAHCKVLVPSNGLTLDCQTKTATYVLNVASGTSTLDPDTGKLDGNDLAAGVWDSTTKAFHIKSLSIAAGATLVGKGGAAAPLILLVDDDATIDGTLDIAAHLTTSTTSVGGPGAATNGDGSNARAVTAGTGPGTGAGGGSYGSAGADGARTTVNTGGIAGATYGAPELVPLQGGSRGGAPAGSTSTRGAGGGALQITACGTITVSATALVNAGGGGGPKSTAASTYSGGAGGGAGGGILLEAPSVLVGGVLAAAGGGGGGGAVGAASNLHGEAGSDARTTSCTANGGAGATGGGGGTGGTGGSGACAIDPNTPMAASSGTTGITGGTDLQVGNGGGGGGGGRIRINTPSGIATVGAMSVNPNTAANFSQGTLTLQ